MSKSDEERITEFFNKYNSNHLSHFFGGAVSQLLEFTEEFNEICLFQISQTNPAHITNKAMNECLSKYHEWGEYISGGNRGLVHKFVANAQILAHQIDRYNWYQGAADDDSTKKKIEIGNELNFDVFFKSMFSLTDNKTFLFSLCLY